MYLATRMPLAVVVAALSALPAPVARGASGVTPRGTIYSRPASADGSQRIFAGNVTPFGPITGTLTFKIVDFSTGEYSGQFTLQKRSGTAYGTFEGSFTSPDLSTYKETLTFTGGTGAYAGISGEAYVTGTMHSDGTATDEVVGGQIGRH